MTRKTHLALISEMIRALQIGTPVSRTLIMILLEPWPDLYRDAMARESVNWVNLLQAAAVTENCPAVISGRVSCQLEPYVVCDEWTRYAKRQCKLCRRLDL
jgi:hypothetical protein